MPPLIRLAAGAASLAALAGVLAMPSGLESALDGLPWATPAEALTVAAALPLLLLLDRRWLSFRPALYFITALFCLKLVLALYAPQAGWCLRVYAGAEAAGAGRQEHTWEGLWRRGCNALLTRPYRHPRDLPAEWLNRLDQPQRQQAAPFLRVAGYAVVPPGWGLAVAAGGIQGGLFWARDAQGRLHEVPLLKDPAEARRLEAGRLPSGVLAVGGHLAYGPLAGSAWSLVPLLVGPGGQVAPALGRGVLWRDRAGVEMDPSWRARLGLISRLVEGGLWLWLLGWLAWALWSLGRQGILTRPAALATATGLVMWWLLPRLGHDPLFVPHGAAFAALGVLTLLTWRAGRDEVPAPGLAVLLAVGPLLLLHFGHQWAGEAGRFHLYSVGDDWLTYQRWARAIVLEGDPWMSRTAPVFLYQPLYRYLVALLHALFGPSPLAQNLLDVWAAIAGAGLGAALARRLGASTVWAFIAAWLYLDFELGDRFLLHIGLGLQEHAAMLCMLLAAWAALRARERTAWAWAAGLLAAAGFWLRMDHLGVLAGLGLLMVAEEPGGVARAWQGLWQGAWARRRRLAVYGGCLLGAALLVMLRNGICGGRWVLLHPSNQEVLVSPLWDNLNALLDVLDGSDRGFLKAAWVMWPGTVLGLAALAWRPGPLRRYPLALGLGLAGLLAPYVYVQANAYFPRWSVHLLPLACLSLALAGDAAARWAKRLRANPSGGAGPGAP